VETTPMLKKVKSALIHVDTINRRTWANFLQFIPETNNSIGKPR